MKTRTSLFLLGVFALLAFLAVPVLGEEPVSEPALEPAPPVDPLQAHRNLAAVVTAEDISWRKAWRAYQDAKPTLDADRELLAPARAAWEKREDEQGTDPLTEEETASAETWDAFVPIQTSIAEALRRDNLLLGGWLMAFVAASLLWGGFAVTVTIAIRATKQRAAEASAKE